MKKLNVDMVDTSPAPTQGHSQPEIVIAEDGNRYILKSEPDSPLKLDTGKIILHKEDAVLAQEALCYQLAKAINIPVPDCAILNISKNFIINNPGFRFSHKINEGIYFGSKVIPSLTNSSENYKNAMTQGKKYAKRTWKAFFKDVSNPQIYPNIIAFDLLTLNGDRFCNTGNLLVASNTKKVYAIDFGHCFMGPFWIDEKKIFLNFYTPPNYKSFSSYIIDTLLEINLSFMPGAGFGEVFRAMENNISFENGNPFCDIVHKIEELPDSKIEEILYSIPEEWIVGSNIERNLYCTFLSKNKYNIRDELQIMCNYGGFSNFVGGNLDWTQKDKSTGIQ